MFNIVYSRAKYRCFKIFITKQKFCIVFVSGTLAHRLLRFLLFPHTGPGGAKVIGTLGNNITLTFTFNETAINYNSHFAVYLNDRKIAEYTGHRRFMLGDVFDIYQNTSVRYHISKLYLNKSGSYRMTLFQDSTKLKESDNEVHLTVLRGNTSSTGKRRSYLSISTSSSGQACRWITHHC